MEAFGKFMTIVLTMIISTIINGYILSKLWVWIIVPTFLVSPLRLIEAIGIVILIGFIRIRKDTEVNPDNFWEKWLENIIFLIITGSLYLLSGWIVKQFI